MKLKELTRDCLTVRIYDSRRSMGAAAAYEAAGAVRKLLERKETLCILFAAAPSQNEFLEAFGQYDLPWEQIHALHMDEYIGLSGDSPQRFGNYLKEHLFGFVPFRSVRYLFKENASPEAVCTRYRKLLQAYPPDVVCMGIGENGHIAFNDPHVARFDDPETVKIVTLDEVCRAQQVHDGCFASLAEVPRQAVTVTIPAMMQAARIFCIVPGGQKAGAIEKTMNGPLTPRCPASVLRTHPQATLYCDRDSASFILKKEEETK